MNWSLRRAWQRAAKLNQRAGIQDRDGAPDVLKAIVSRYPSLRHIFADGGYAGPKLRDALKYPGHWTLQIIRRSDTAEGFEVLPGGWGIGRTSPG